MRIEHITHGLLELGAKPCHQQRILRAWAQGQALEAPAGPSTICH